jgi:carboxypeptidase Taq
MTADAYSTILNYANRIHDIEQADHLLRWDSDVMMPAGGETARASQRATLSKQRHDLRADDTLADALAAVEPDDHTPAERAIVREIRRQHEIASAVPLELNEKLADVTAEAHEAWKSAKEADDWGEFAPMFERHIELRRKWAAAVDPEGDPYEVLWKNKLGYESQPYIDLATVERVFDRLREELVSLIEDIKASDAEIATEAFADRGPYDPDKQMALHRTVLDQLGLDWDRARFDTAPHPFSYGNPYDVRLTTRFDEADPTAPLASTMHEFGHTTYHHGLPQEHYGTPLGRARSLTIHGSQSGVWENHVCKSREFWEWVLPMFREQFPQLGAISPQEAYEAANQVQEANVIRTAADELTYHMHVLVRTEIEQELVAGSLDVEAVPQVWADKYENYLGVRPDSDSEGPLQDPHWAVNIPGFINYTLGHGVLAAQVWAAAGRDLALNELVRTGEFGPIREWMTDNIHAHGQRYKPQELVRRATGESITAEYFLDYIETKYRDLYDC